MPADRFYSPAAFIQGLEITLVEQEFLHAIKVMRAQEGESIELVNGKGQLAIGIIRKIGKKEALISLDKIFEEPYPARSTILAQAITKVNRLDLIIEKGCELGMDELWLFPGLRSEKKEISENQLTRMESICISALKQSGRLWLPAVKVLPRLQDWKEFKWDRAYFGDTRSEAPLFQTAWRPGSRNVFFIGPESGFADQELVWLEEHHVQGVKLHANILRAETAPLLALGLMRHWLLLD